MVRYDLLQLSLFCVVGFIGCTTGANDPRDTAGTGVGLTEEETIFLRTMWPLPAPTGFTDKRTRRRSLGGQLGHYLFFEPGHSSRRGTSHARPVTSPS